MQKWNSNTSGSEHDFEVVCYGVQQSTCGVSVLALLFDLGMRTILISIL